jgi:poly(3-hydroxybutyrate) depolymerase
MLAPVRVRLRRHGAAGNAAIIHDVPLRLRDGDTSMMPPFSRRSVLSGLAACAAASAFSPSAIAAGLSEGVFRFELPVRFLEGRTMRVWGYSPPRATGPVVMVMHGQGRNAAEYRDFWIEGARAHGLTILAPEFDRDGFPTSREYNMGRVAGAGGNLRPEEARSFGLIEQVFDAARERLQIDRDGFTLFGHSAGAQFVHRFMLFTPDARVTHAIAANAGWYTLPVFDHPYPHGAAEAGLTGADIERYLAAPLTIMLGDADTDTSQSSLNTDPEVMVQGAHRFARGRHVFELARAEAGRRGAPFGWSQVIVPDVAHSGDIMSRHAADLIGGAG